MIQLINGDCLQEMERIPDGSVDLVLCDLPYGTTACKWDIVIPFEPLWTRYQKIIKQIGAILLFGTQPFTSFVIQSKLEWFRYCWYWEKERGTGFARTGFQPLRLIEEVATFSSAPAVFCRSAKSMQYYPQMEKLEHPYIHALPINKSGSDFVRNNNGDTRMRKYKQYTHKHPTTRLKFPRDYPKLHPTQKPVALCEYLIRTYTNKGDTVLDNCMGSGTTGVACINTGRNFIGIEKEESYFKIAEQRIAQAQAARHQRLFTTA